jgi:hypothetical protein
MSMVDEDDISDYDFSEDKFILSNAIEVAPATIQIEFGLASESKD